MTDLTLKTLERANIIRLPRFRNSKGELSHSTNDGSDWSLNDWMTALVGEVGELANMFKKVRRGDYTFEDKRKDIEDEFADILIYLSLMASVAKVNLSEVTIRKFNEKSVESKANVFIGDGNTITFTDNNGIILHMEYKPKGT